METGQTAKRLAYWAVLGACLLMLLSGVLNHRLFLGLGTAKLFFHLGLWVAVAGLATGLRTVRTWLGDAFLALSGTSYLFFRWPDVFFDDAGFILRYLDQSNQGSWFNFNAGEGPVFGISGFLHGLLSTLLVKIGFAPEAALIASNLIGVFLCFLFLSGIFRHVLGMDFLAYLLAGSTLLLSKFFCNVAFTGMEMPLHVAFVLGALLFLLQRKTWPFFIFCALAVVSKLDAVPVVGVFVGIFGLRTLLDIGLWKGIRSVALPLLLGFFLPVLLWVAFAYWFFGSPLPQSAQAKMLYHSGGIQGWFPFLQWMLEEPYKRIQIGLMLGLALLHVLFARKTNGRSILEGWSMGWAFLAVLTLYYVYNPNERMLWYYSLPDVLLTGQCLMSLAWLGSEAKGEAADTLGYAAACIAVFFLKPDVDGGRNWVEKHVVRLESERERLGKEVASWGGKEDTLISWHGLIGRPFPGFVLDGTGLNSRMAVQFGLDCGKMLREVKPRWGVHHGHSDLLNCFSLNGYKIRSMSADVSLDGNPAWFVWEANAANETPSSVFVLSKSQLKSGDPTLDYPLLAKGTNVGISLPKNGNRKECLWFALERKSDHEQVINLALKAGDLHLGATEFRLKPRGEVVFASTETQSFSWVLPQRPDSLAKSPMYLEWSSGNPADTVFLIQPILESR